MFLMNILPFIQKKYDLLHILQIQLNVYNLDFCYFAIVSWLVFFLRNCFLLEALIHSFIHLTNIFESLCARRCFEPAVKQYYHAPISTGRGQVNVYVWEVK